MTIPSPATCKRRLLMLAAFLRRLPPKRFDYSRWVGEDWKGDPNLSCGTTACALGWATTIPALRRAGLRLTAGGWLAASGGDDSGAADASKRIFGLTYTEHDQLFTYGLEDATAKQVAAHIERFVAKKYPTKEKRRG